MLRALALDAQLVRYLLQTAIQRVPVQETFNVQQVREEELQNFVELVSARG